MNRRPAASPLPQSSMDMTNCPVPNPPQLHVATRPVNGPPRQLSSCQQDDNAIPTTTEVYHHIFKFTVEYPGSTIWRLWDVVRIAFPRVHEILMGVGFPQFIMTSIRAGELKIRISDSCAYPDFTNGDQTGQAIDRYRPLSVASSGPIIEEVYTDDCYNNSISNSRDRFTSFRSESQASVETPKDAPVNDPTEEQLNNDKIPSEIENEKQEVYDEIVMQKFNNLMKEYIDVKFIPWTVRLDSKDFCDAKWNYLQHLDDLILALQYLHQVKPTMHLEEFNSVWKRLVKKIFPNLSDHIDCAWLCRKEFLQIKKRTHIRVEPNVVKSAMINIVDYKAAALLNHLKSRENRAHDLVSITTTISFDLKTTDIFADESHRIPILRSIVEGYPELFCYRRLPKNFRQDNVTEHIALQKRLPFVVVSHELSPGGTLDPEEKENLKIYGRRFRF